MPRMRTTHIRESTESLRRHLEHEPDPSRRNRLRVILAIREDATRTIAEVSAALDIPERTVHRWLAVYREHGLAGLLSIARSGVDLSDGILEELRRQVERGAFGTVADVRRWLVRAHGLDVSLPTAAAAIQRAVGPLDARMASPPAADDAGWVRRFLESLPHRVDAPEWIELFRRSLSEVIDADRITVDVNVRSLSPASSLDARKLTITHHVRGDAPGTEVVAVDPIDEPLIRGRRIIGAMKRGGFPVARYRKPHVEEFIAADGTYLGTIIVWRLRSRPAPGIEVRDFLDSSRSLISALFADCAARHECQQPVNAVFYSALEQLSITARLTRAQQRVLTLRLLGHSYDQIADAIETRVDTVHKHMRAVYAKAHVQGFNELYAKHFTPRLR